jgi:hypothetical protein
MPQQPGVRKGSPSGELRTAEGPAAGAAEDGATDGGSGQSHPLYRLDRDIVDRLLAAEVPGEADLVDAARLLSRYAGFPGAFDLQNDLERAIRLWGMGTEELRARTRALWQGGHRPGSTEGKAEPVGSGFDATGDPGT